MHLGVDEHGRLQILPNGLLLNDKDYHYFYACFSQSKCCIHLFDEHQIDSINWKFIKHIPYTKHEDNDYLHAHLKEGLTAHNSLKNTGLKHLRLSIDVKLKAIDSNYCPTKGAGRPPKNFQKTYFEAM